MCYLMNVRTGLFLLCGGVFCTAVYCHCMSDPSCWKKVSGVPELRWVIVLQVAGRGIRRSLGAEWLGLFCGYGIFSNATKILLGELS